MLNQNELSGQSIRIDSHSARIHRMRKGILTGSRLICERLASDSVRWVPVMVTLTYAMPGAWEPWHISKFLNAVQEWGQRAGYKLPYAWVMELTKAGTPHYHCIVWIPRRLRLPRADSRGWWSHGTSNTVRATNPYGYLQKYASKGGLARGRYPKGCRIHGIGGITCDEARIIAWWKLPKCLRVGDEGCERWRRSAGGGWVCIEGDRQGELYISDYGLSVVNAREKYIVLVQKHKDAKPEPVIPDVQVWRERVFEDGVAAGAKACATLEAYREGYVWSGPVHGYQHPTDAPILQLSEPVGPQDSYRALPIPF